MLFVRGTDPPIRLAPLRAGDDLLVVTLPDSVAPGEYVLAFKTIDEDVISMGLTVNVRSSPPVATTTRDIEKATPGVQLIPDTPGDHAQYTIIFGANTELKANADTITVRFDRDVAIPLVISRDSVVVSADAIAGAGTPGKAVHPTVEPLIEFGLGGQRGAAVTISVPDMDPDPGTGLEGIAKGATVSVIFDVSVGFINPSEGGTEYTVIVGTSADAIEVASYTFAVPRTLDLDRSTGSRESFITVVGRGFKNGTTATLWLDKDQDDVLDPDEVVLDTVPIGSDDTFTVSISVAVPPFQLGQSFINAVDGRNNVASAPAIFELKGRVTVSPKEAAVGDTVLVTLKDFPTNYPVPGGVSELLGDGYLTLGGIDVPIPGFTGVGGAQPVTDN